MYGPYPSDRVRRGLTKPETSNFGSYSDCPKCGNWHEKTDDCRFEDAAIWFGTPRSPSDA